ncbi:ABC transporter substrate-binding protein [Gordonia sp. ABSL1-1]|uniref:ABC transporter substrate-binding protein n=1 Tax=Gordonia sp. ABSL1-1 TaxID=3053923 RepID=UPI00257421FA|nr:ABC transporter substrate-binding protein [Gordonia sp. ABSL1-1]MDL9936439.1 ABC transporter substrate-binding protein [Gordonia sp. ABSL1-1]
MTTRTRTYLRALIAVVGVALVAGTVTACGDDGPPTIDYAVDARIASYNANTIGGNADGVLMVTGRIQPGFSFLGAFGQVIPDHDVGTVTRAPGSVLSLRYEFAPEAVFSDGTALDCDDLVLAWAAMSGRFAAFRPATTAGYRDIASVDCAAGERTAVVRFKPGRAYQNWAALFGAGTLLPAHVVARDAGVGDVLTPIRAGAQATVAGIAKSWNDGFALKPGPVDATRFPSAGPYRVDRYSKTDGLVLVANDKWWGDKPRTGRIVVWPRQTDATRRLPAGRYDVADVTTGMIDGEMSGSNGSSVPGRALAVEQLVLAGRGIAADPLVRQAFASCVPRETLAKRFGDGGRLWNQRILSPADNTAGAINGEFGRRYLRPDPARSRALLQQRAQAGASGPVRIRIAYLAPTTRRAQMVAAIAGACQAVGIEAIDASAPDIDVTALGTGFDALLVAGGASMSAAGAADPVGAAYALRAGDPSNLSGFRDPQVSGAVDALAVANAPGDRLPLIRAIENAAWSALPTIPLFAAPRTQRWNDRTGAVVAGYARSGTGWNMDRWTLGDN